jgi:hypothetical protein
LALVCTNLFAQLKLGDMTFVSMSAPVLTNPDHLSIGLRSHRFLATVGGVAFDKVAIPAVGLDLTSLSLSYRSDLADGSRLGIAMNGKRIMTQIYDWQLVPIVRFAESPYYSCFTLFGKLADSGKQKQVLDQGGRILNYHPAFINTLLGLRLFQLDILILDNACSDLPKDGNRYILGNGESEPNVLENQMRMNNFVYHVNEIESDLRLKFRSYVICDFNQDIRFDIQNDSLMITGAPFYYCWRFRSDDPEYDQKVDVNRITQEIDDSLKSEGTERPQTFEERKWYIQALIQQARDYEARYEVFSEGTVVDLVKKKDDRDRERFLDMYYTSSLRELLVQMRLAMDAFDVVYLKEYSERLSSRPDILRGINPAVWDVASYTMRYAAFFRFCKEKFPNQWEDFAKQIRNMSVGPSVTTPTVMYDPRHKKMNR